ncbi:MAG: Gfo/Idh/MocA family oxidoreductase [Actinomycetota bacterium]|nr:Gfo/Idh/MocA family oxidoreductase [Actinomycetota bacterium]
MTTVGLFGYGYWGAHLARNLIAMPDVRLAAVVDPDAERRRDAEVQVPGVTIDADPDAVLGDPGVDAVVVATPLASHYPLARAALAAGKHVMVEKPFTATSKEATHLVDVAERHGLTLMVNHTAVYSDAMVTIRRLADGGRLGELRYYDSVRASEGRFRPGEDVLWDLAVHDLGCLDAMRPGGPVALSATGAAHPAGARHSIAHLTLFYADDMIAHLQASWLSPIKLRRILVGGSRRQVVFDDDVTKPSLTVYETNTEPWSPHLDPGEALLIALGHFVGCVSSGAAPLSDGRSGQRVVGLLEHASSSLAARGRPVDLETR